MNPSLFYQYIHQLGGQACAQKPDGDGDGGGHSKLRQTKVKLTNDEKYKFEINCKQDELTAQLKI